MSKKTDNYSRCLFLKIEDKIGAVVYINGELHVLKFSGEIKTDYSESFWNEWIMAVGYLTGQPTDFCLIGNEAWEFPEKINRSAIPEADSCWDRSRVIDALALIVPHDRRIVIKTTAGSVLYGSANETEAIVLFASFPKDAGYTEQVKLKEKIEAAPAEKPAEPVAEVYRPEEKIWDAADARGELAKYFQSKIALEEAKRNR
ncbi:MAG: hypothetical protein NC299_04030 [Lachnospiraceae bacterium]|nr:hypothetical protein [Ruminococcus sp.]MCM1274516.1 hypothetical protein [Lachnospiraceae bacterium]